MAEQRLTRSRTDRRIAGVCGGLARHFDVDTVFMRLGFVAAVFIPPFAAAAIVGYIAAWIIVPEEPEPAEAFAPAAAGAAGGAGGAGGAGVAGEGGGPEPGGFQPAEQRPFAEAPPAATEAAPHRGFPRDASLVGGLIFIALGFFFLLLNLGLLPWDILRFWRWRVLWPVVVILAGAVMLLRAVRMGGARADGA